MPAHKCPHSVFGESVVTFCLSRRISSHWYVFKGCGGMWSLSPCASVSLDCSAVGLVLGGVLLSWSSSWIFLDSFSKSITSAFKCDIASSSGASVGVSLSKSVTCAHRLSKAASNDFKLSNSLGVWWSVMLSSALVAATAGLWFVSFS